MVLSCRHHKICLNYSLWCAAKNNGQRQISWRGTRQQDTATICQEGRGDWETAPCAVHDLGSGPICHVRNICLSLWAVFLVVASESWAYVTAFEALIWRSA